MASALRASVLRASAPRSSGPFVVRRARRPQKCPPGARRAAPAPGRSRRSAPSLELLGPAGRRAGARRGSAFFFCRLVSRARRRRRRSGREQVVRARRARAGRRTGFLARAVGSSGPGASQRADVLLQPLAEKQANHGTLKNHPTPPCGWFFVRAVEASVFATLITACARARRPGCAWRLEPCSFSSSFQTAKDPRTRGAHEARRSWRAKGGRAQHSRQKKISRRRPGIL